MRSINDHTGQWESPPTTPETQSTTTPLQKPRRLHVSEDMPGATLLEEVAHTYATLATPTVAKKSKPGFERGSSAELIVERPTSAAETAHAGSSAALPVRDPLPERAKETAPAVCGCSLM
jgi:hypothetical protein